MESFSAPSTDETLCRPSVSATHTKVSRWSGFVYALTPIVWGQWYKPVPGFIKDRCHVESVSGPRSDEPPWHLPFSETHPEVSVEAAVTSTSTARSVSRSSHAHGKPTIGPSVSEKCHVSKRSCLFHSFIAGGVVVAKPPTGPSVSEA